MKAHALNRMQEGLKNLLHLHTSVELSSICGYLGLKSQQKGATSIEQILAYASEKEELNEERIRHILNGMWEGVLWEYLHSIGHPVYSMLPDPKLTILKIWQEGGSLDPNNKSFVPHFVAREVKKRNEWIQSEDITSRLNQLYLQQEVTKKTERQIVADHDYTNILSFFQSLYKLRNMENSVREYLISELEIARSRVDSNDEVLKLNRRQQKENELYFMKISQDLNEKLIILEMTSENVIEDNIFYQKQLLQLKSILDSYISTHDNRIEPGGGTIQALKPRLQSNMKTILLEEIYDRLQTFRDKILESDDQLRHRARCHVDEIHDLKAQLHDLQENFTTLQEKYNHLEEFNHHMIHSYLLSERKNIKSDQIEKEIGDLSWSFGLEKSSELLELQFKIKTLKPLISSIIYHSSNKQLVNLAATMNSMFGIHSPEKTRELEETILMKRQDELAAVMRLQLQAKLTRTKTLNINANLGGKGSKSAKSPSKGSSKRPGTSGSEKGGDEATVKTNATDNSKKSKSSKKPSSASSTKSPSKSPTKSPVKKPAAKKK